jgi:rod shape-determining protein MreC
MELLLSRFRNLTVLVAVLLAQLILLAYQVKSSADVPLIRVWAVTAVTPAARVLETLRSGTVGFARDYIFLKDARDENRRLREELVQTKLRNQYLAGELETADRVKALSEFTKRNPSKTIAARIIMTGTGADSKVVFLDRGSVAGVMRGMAVITADGIVGQVVNAYPTASQVLLATDPTFAASVVSQKNHVHGTLKGGAGRNTCIVDHVQNEEKVEVGEWFYTSGEDRVFPKGLPAGQVRAVHDGKLLKDIIVEPSALQGGVEEVLIVLEGVHQPIPTSTTPPSTETYVLPPPPPDNSPSRAAAPVNNPDGTPKAAAAQPAKGNTDADRLLERYQEIGQQQNHVFGAVGSRVPDFNAGSKAQVPKPSAPPTAQKATPPPAIAEPDADTEDSVTLPSVTDPDAPKAKPAAPAGSQVPGAGAAKKSPVPAQKPKAAPPKTPNNE